MKRIHIILILVLLLNSCVRHEKPLIITPDEKFTEIRKEIINLVKSKKVGSFSVAVIKKNEILWKESFIDVEDSIRIESDAVYPIASMSKSMSATIVHKLSDRGVLSLDDPVVKYVKDFSFPIERSLTLKELLNMTAGVPHGWIFIESKFQNEKIDVNELSNLYNFTSFPKGVYEYSNFSYGILERVIEKVTDETYDEVMQRELFAPLEMNNSYVKIEDSEYLTSTEKYSFYPKAGAGIYSNLSDLMKYATLHLKQKEGFMSMSSLHKMHNEKTSKDGVMALGIGNISLNDNNTWLVSNGSFSFPITSNSNLTILPDKELAIICLADKDYNSMADITSIKIANLFSPKFQEIVFAKIEAYEKGRDLSKEISEKVSWRGYVKHENLEVPFYLKYDDKQMFYRSDTSSTYKKVKNIKLDHQSIVRGNIQLRIQNPFTKELELADCTINLKLDDNRLVGYVAASFKSKGEYFISIPFFTEVKKV